MKASSIFSDQLLRQLLSFKMQNPDISRGLLDPAEI